LREAAQHCHRVICGLRLYVPAVEKITRDKNEIYAPSNGVALDYVSPCTKEVARAVGQVIPLDAEMNIGYVKKPCHIEFILYMRAAVFSNALGALHIVLNF